MSELKNILKNKKTCKSIWFMRQAGRYLPEFRKIRAQNPNFIKICLNSELSSEITLQPIKRFNLDSAIIFSDILMVPYALGQEVNFEKNLGPKLSEFKMSELLINNEKKFSQKLSPVYKAIEITRKKLDKKKSLICFIGAPWTLIIYMLNIKGNNSDLNIEKLKIFNSNIKQIFEELHEYLCIHIKNQINAGADVVQIFDSWAGLVPIDNMNDYCFLPNKKLVDFCKKSQIPNICFPKGINEKYKEFNETVKPDCISLDKDVDPLWIRDNLKDVVFQGGLDPRVMLDTEEEIKIAATKYIKIFKDIPYVFNLGHGLLPETDPAKVDSLIKFFRSHNG